MADPVETILTTCGREAGRSELEHTREVIRLCRGLSRHELALTLCEHWGWVGPNGGLQERACSKLLEKWEAAGLVRLPEKDVSKQRQSLAQKPIAATTRTAEQEPINCELAQLQPVWLEVVSGREATALWSEYVSRYHPLGCKRTIGCTLRYFVSSERGRLGCLLMGNAAMALAVRDKWVGWSRQERLAHLPWVINNQRLLLFPWVRVPHLVSHVLGQLARRVQGDWEARWGYRPVLMETFVDPAHYRGVGYRAAGWLLLGQSTGEGIRRGQHTYRTTPKMIFVRPLVLCGRAYAHRRPGWLCVSAVMRQRWLRARRMSGTMGPSESRLGGGPVDQHPENTRWIRDARVPRGRKRHGLATTQEAFGNNDGHGDRLGLDVFCGRHSSDTPIGPKPRP